MATLELYVTGDEIGFYNSVSVSGKSNGTKVILGDTNPLGSSTDVFRIEISGVSGSDTGFEYGMIVTVYAYPDTAPPTPIYTSQLSDPDAYNGRATSADHFIFDGVGDTGLVIDLDGISTGDHQIGPGISPTRYQEFEFSSLSTTPPVFPCFAKGTLIETDAGPIAVESLTIGDLVRTMDNGFQPIRWIGNRKISGRADMAPILIRAGALGNYRNLYVSPQHRMLVNDWRSEMYFGEPQVFVAAKHLTNDSTIRSAPCDEVTYVHMSFDQHEVIYAEGIPSESLHLGAMTMSSLDRASKAEVLTLFPELQVNEPSPIAHACLRRWEGELLQIG
ncbi:Hint domain-containing protein [Octadecabacter temperatus]|uniref:Hint domain-containing protein n=1 Tax=Octadecabacter temperatus TaxID=1458307 RepID=UPI00130E211E|nr:Hint domain-containing protein [Octadecabacter temperatus]